MSPTVSEWILAEAPEETMGVLERHQRLQMAQVQSFIRDAEPVGRTPIQRQALVAVGQSRSIAVGDDE